VLALLISVGMGCGGCPEGSSAGDDGLCYLDGDDTGAAETDTDTDTDTDTGEDTDTPTSVAALGGGTHSMDAFDIVEIATASGDQLSRPMDMAFSTERPDELWIVDQTDDAIVIVFDALSDARTSGYYSGSEASHWLAQPSGIAFGDPGYVATSHESLGWAEGTQRDPATEMGPSLWPTDLELFDGGRPSHLDMVHDSALSGGIAWERENIYWVHDGYKGSLTRYDFAEPHEPGGTYHDDATVHRYLQGEVGYVAGVAAHLAFDSSTDILYAADPANSRIIALDTDTGEDGGDIPISDGGMPSGFTGDVPPPHGNDLLDKHYVIDADWWTVDLEAPLEAPAGLELHDGLLFVTDNTTATVYAFGTDGTLVDWLETGLAPGSLMGMAFDSEGRLYLADAGEARIIRLDLR